MALLDESSLEGERLLQWMRCVCVCVWGGGGGGGGSEEGENYFLRELAPS